MKINERIDSYNIKSLSSIDNAVKSIRRRCENMDMLGKALRHNIETAKENGYQDKNSERAEAIIEEYCKKLQECRLELEELGVSVKKYIDKLDDIWNSWN